MKIKKNILITIVIIFSVYILSIYSNIANATSLELYSQQYYIHDNYIERVYPKTTISEFKKNLGQNVIIYENNKKEKEITTGTIKTGMIATVLGNKKDYQISVIGDINKDGLLNQVDVSFLIKYLIGIENYELTDILYKSADIKFDGKVNQIDLTSAINYLVIGSLENEFPKNEDKIPPTINLSEQLEYGTPKITITAIIEDGLSGVTLQKWAKGEKDIAYFKERGNIFEGNTFEVSYNGVYTVYAKDYAGNESIKTITVTKVDSVGPKINNFSTIEITNSSITMNIDAEDERGLYKENPYTYYISEDSNFVNAIEVKSTNKNYKFENLKHNTTYYIKVSIKDGLGNITTSTILNVNTLKIPDSEDRVESGEKAIEITNPVWQNEVANVEIINRSNYYTQYKVLNSNGDIIKDWTITLEKRQKIENLYHNYIVIVRLSEKQSLIEGNFGSEIEKTIKDTLAPEITLTEQEYYTNEQSTITVNITENESGIEIVKYDIGEKTTDYFKNQGMELTENTFKVDENGIYTVYAKDKAGNESVEQINAKKINREDLIATILNIEENRIYTNKDIIEITIKTNKEFIEVNKNKIILTGTGSAGGTLELEKQDDKTLKVKVTVGNGNGILNIIVQSGAFRDSSGNVNNEVIKNNITYIDNKGPEIKYFNVIQTTTNSITVEVNAEETEGVGMATENIYSYYICSNETFENEIAENSDDSTYTFTELMQNTSYYLKVVVKDKIGNKSTSIVSIGTTKTVPDGNERISGSQKYQIEFENIVWKDQKAKVTINNNSEYKMQYKILNSNNLIIQDWLNAEEESVTVEELENNYLVMARLSDNEQTTIGNYGSEATNLILDTTYPTVTLTQQTEAVNTEITVNARIIEEESRNRNTKMGIRRKR